MPGFAATGGREGGEFSAALAWETRFPPADARRMLRLKPHQPGGGAIGAAGAGDAARLTMITRLRDDVPDDSTPARAWHYLRCACGGALALATGTGVFVAIGAALLGVLPDGYDNTALVAAGLGGGALVLAAFVVPRRLSTPVLCAGCALLLAVGALLLLA